MIWTLSHPMYLLLDHFYNKYFINNYKCLFMISRSENIVTHITTSLSIRWISCPTLLNKLRITYSSQRKTYTCVYIEKSLIDCIYAFLLLATDIYVFLKLDVNSKLTAIQRVKFSHFPYLNKAAESFTLCLTDTNKFICI